VVENLVENLLSPHDFSLLGCSTYLEPDGGSILDSLGRPQAYLSKMGAQWTVPFCDIAKFAQDSENFVRRISCSDYIRFIPFH
jgi:hypothetical protein